MLTLGDREAIEVRTEAALKQRRPVDHEMMRRDVKKGVAALCLGGGNSVALAVER